jgi:ABC-type glycerol-3-phosphate transport system permease component
LSAVWRHRSSKALVYVVLLAVTAIMLYPFWLMGQMSFRSLPQYYLGKGFSLTTWHDLFNALPVGRELMNSTLITLCSIAVILAVSTMGGYALGTLRYRLSGVVFLIVLSSMMVPMQSMIIPEYINLARLGFINHY